MARGGARWRWWLPQIGLLAMVVAGLAWLAANVADNLARRGIATGLSFLDRAARFPISESILPYSPVDSFAWAIIVGLGNTLFLSVLVAAISTLLGLPIGEDAKPWMGARPTLPDYLPAIGRVPGVRGVSYAFGHNHLGLTLAPITGELVAGMLEGDATAVSLTPFGLERFS